MDHKLQKTLDRFKEKLEEGDLYEAHQTLRSLVNRKIRVKKYGEAIELLFNGAKQLLESSQPTTGQDLFGYLLEVYQESQEAVSEESKSRLIKLISLLDAKDPGIKKISIEAINWSIANGDNKFGDCDLHLALGLKYLENNETSYDAERHLLLSGSSATGFDNYIGLIWGWFQEDPNGNSAAGKYAIRVVFNYLFLENFEFALKGLDFFLQKLVLACDYDTIEELNKSFLIFKPEEDFRLITFLQLLLITIQYKNTEFFKRLVNHYSRDIEEIKYKDGLSLIGEIFFGIQAPRQANFLQDLMSGFLGGGGQR